MGDSKPSTRNPDAPTETIAELSGTRGVASVDGGPSAFAGLVKPDAAPALLYAQTCVANCACVVCVPAKKSAAPIMVSRVQNVPGKKVRASFRRDNPQLAVWCVCK